MKRFFLFVVGVTLAGHFSPSTADENAATQTARVGDYTLTLPADWVQIPGDVLDAAEVRMAEVAPQVGRQDFVAGFQQAGADHWMAYPYVLVQEIRKGRLPESELDQFKSLDMDSVSGRLEGQMNGFISQVEMGQMVFDRENLIVWWPLSQSVQGVGPIKGLAGINLTSFGGVQVMGYATSDEFPRYQGLFVDIATSFDPDSDIEYRYRESASESGGTNTETWMEILGRAVAAGIIGGLIGLFVYRSRRKH